ncbi:MAG: response regulator transcription factor [Lachnospiraceae bacterium]|nr:response regulator transcription factor [Lachnospiraceae bacterium]
MTSLLIIEDDIDLREGLAFTFQSEGYQIFEAGTVHQARLCLKNNPIQGILLDCNLPDGNGFDFCREIRKTSGMPIMMLTARDSELDEVKALELGVSDYRSKPFSVAVLKAMIRKMQHPVEQTILQSGNITIHLSDCKVQKNQKELELSAIEYKLLLYLMQNKDQVLSKEQILEQIWEKDGQFVDDNIVSVNISRLRAKIEDYPRKPERIKTIHGMGYLWKEKSE